MNQGDDNGRLKSSISKQRKYPNRKAGKSANLTSDKSNRGGTLEDRFESFCHNHLILVWLELLYVFFFLVCSMSPPGWSVTLVVCGASW